jgi:hypothetical protein
MNRFTVDNFSAPITVNLVQDTAVFGVTNRDRANAGGTLNDRSYQLVQNSGNKGAIMKS